MIHIGLCADERFALPFGVCLTSILESNKDNEIVIHVLTKGFKEETIAKIKQTTEKYHKIGMVKLYDINDEIFDSYPVYENFPKSIYYRYLFAEILPVDIEKIIYLDCDTVVVSDLCTLWNTNIEGKLLAAVEDRNSDDIVIRNRIEMWKGHYFNSGVLLMNLSYWRKHDCFAQMACFILKNPKVCIYPDQDALNVVFQDKIECISFRYNFLMSFIEPFESYRLHKSKRKEIIDSFKNLVIIHFAAEKKPWFKDTKHPLFFIWRYYYKKSVWKSVPLKNKDSFVVGICKKIVKSIVYRNLLPSINPLFIEDLKRYQKLYLS
ncbi:glycosyltransferase family 8 protein [Bacteroides acidifaciens]|uniref:Glycosyltransferase family 8 protein n=2 Tax=Bacteroides acidifaciens TaxID=85831 RepID=A0A7K3MN38_9BACE|nr:glycosyltransferase family 8 protein [Bacteroides acidifaciens]MBF0728246.1 glycosyltransferase family 8 protein [Bacteroides acidifaciens]MBF0835654.1 glycosyltransferase family 8 protein [Bacteroides acidifaciens]NDO55932.1 glycosyltransferase family 8 protein [Bacteroides acidifaciens]TFU52719.1 glycosyltransferase family 8 protein [Bacteroides acidifaciens]